MKVAQLCAWNFPGRSTEMDSHSLFQEIFPTQGLNPRLPHCRRILYQPSHKGSHKNKGVGSLFLLQGDLPDPGIKPESPALQANSLPSELSGKSSICLKIRHKFLLVKLCPAPLPRGQLRLKTSSNLIKLILIFH